MDIGKINSFMAQLIRPNQVKVITQDGEIKINLTLDLNLNLNGGNLSISEGKGSVPDFAKEDENEKTEWIIPDFKSAKERKNFGQKKKIESEN